MVDRVLDAAKKYPTVVVASPSLVPSLEPRENLEIIENNCPEFGMAYSLELASRAIPLDRGLLVFLADKPFVTQSLADQIVNAASEKDADVCFPQHDGVGGHPVYFSLKARTRMRDLRGDSLQRLRDHAELVQVPLATDDVGAFRDIDAPDDLLPVSSKETGV